MARLPCFPVCSVLLIVLWITPAAYSHDTCSIELDCSDAEGTVRPFAEINCGPIPVSASATQVDVTRQFQEIGITSVRTHDFYGPTDISMIFPDWTADPSLASSYDFSESDRHINSIVDGGFEVFFRLGESASDNESLRQPPPDFSVWAEVCRHVVMHYNEGWAEGYRYDIRYWEIWNEPDLDGFWAGTAEDYYELYRLAAETLKAHDPDLKVGGPCTSNIADERFAGGFLAYIDEHDVPLDFYSWHNYADSPAELYGNALAVRSMLDACGLTGCENINTEWNINILYPQRDNDNAKNAAFTASCLTAFQDAGLDRAFRYRATQDDSSLLGLMLGFDLSLFAADGTYKAPALSYLAMQYLYRDSPLRLASPAMDASSGITWLAGKAADGSCVSVLVSNYETGDTMCNVRIDSLPFQGGYAAARYRIDDTSHLETVGAAAVMSGAYETSFVLKRNSVVLLRLAASPDQLPPEGPAVADIPLLLQLKILDPIFKLLGYWLLLAVFG